MLKWTFITKYTIITVSYGMISCSDESDFITSILVCHTGNGNKRGQSYYVGGYIDKFGNYSEVRM